MRFRKTLTFLILATGLVFALSALAQQEPVAPGLSPAHAEVAASLPRHGGVKPPLQDAAPKGGATTTLTTPAKPFTQEQVSNMVRDGFGDESGAKLIGQRGIDFAPTEDFYQTLKAAGASEAFLNALRAAKPPEPASAKKPMNQVQVFALLVSQVPSHRVTMLVQERGIDFEPTDDYLQEVRLAGGEDELIAALKSAKVTKPVTYDPTAQRYLTEEQDHTRRGGEFLQKRQYAQAEQEYRAALLLASQDTDLSESIAVTLGYVLVQEGRWNDTATVFREAIRLSPDNGLAHNNLGEVLGKNGDWDGTITEEREALRLDPNDEWAHASLGEAYGKKGDWDRTITEERQALRLDPNDESAHAYLGKAFGQKGDWDGEMAEERKALRLSPNNAEAHNDLGVALCKKGDRRGALEEYRAAYMLAPKDVTYKQNYERLLEQVNK